MKFVNINSKNIPLLKKRVKAIEKDFVPFRKKRKNNPLEDYLVKDNLHMILVSDKNNFIAYISYDDKYKKGGYIRGIWVDKRYRGKGLATKLYRKAINNLKKKNIKQIIVRTWEKNAPSRLVIEKLGFRKYRTIKNDRIDGDNTVWFKLFL